MQSTCGSCAEELSPLSTYDTICDRCAGASAARAAASSQADESFRRAAGLGGASSNDGAAPSIPRPGATVVPPHLRRPAAAPSAAGTQPQAAAAEAAAAASASASSSSSSSGSQERTPAQMLEPKYEIWARACRELLKPPVNVEQEFDGELLKRRIMRDPTAPKPEAKRPGTDQRRPPPVRAPDMTDEEWELALAGYESYIAKCEKLAINARIRRETGNVRVGKVQLDNGDVADGLLMEKQPAARNQTSKKRTQEGEMKIAKDPIQQPRLRPHTAKMAFDCILECHGMQHESTFGTWSKVRVMYNIKQKFVEIFVQVCPYCELRRHNAKTMRRTVLTRFMVSKGPWYRVQIDLKDYQNCPVPVMVPIQRVQGENEDGTLVPHPSRTYVFVLHVRCHFSRMSFLRALENKAALTVAEEIYKLFADLGWPIILQSDNGSEFVNEVSND